MLRFSAIAVSAVFLVFSCSRSPQNVNVAKVIQLDGTVQIQKGEGASYARAYLGSEMLPEYLIKTGPDSRTKVQIGERAVISIEANSVVRIRDLKRDQATGQENTRIEFKGGKSMVNITKKLAAQDSFDVMTPSAVAGVRGTEFLIDTENPEASKIAVTKGSVAVRKRIAAIDDAPAKSDTPLAVREALRELAANQEVAVRVNQEVAVTQKEADAVSAIVDTVVKTASAEMKKASEDNAKPVEAKREAIERQLTAIITESQKKIEAMPEAREVTVVPLSAETRKNVEAIEVVAPVSVELLERLPEKKSEGARDIREVMKEKAPVVEPEKKAEPEKASPTGKQPARVEPARASAQPAARPAEAARTEAKAEPAAPSGVVSLALKTEGAFVTLVSADGKEELALSVGDNKVKAGRWTLKADRKGFKPAEFAVTVEEGKSVSKTVELVKRMVATEKIVLLDGTVVQGKVLSRSETEVSIETEQGVRKIDPRKIDEIIYLKKP
jgi:hypothetical protein